MGYIYIYIHCVLCSCRDWKLSSELARHESTLNSQQTVQPFKNWSSISLQKNSFSDLGYVFRTWAVKHCPTNNTPLIVSVNKKQSTTCVGLNQLTHTLANWEKLATVGAVSYPPACSVVLRKAQCMIPVHRLGVLKGCSM